MNYSVFIYAVSRAKSLEIVPSLAASEQMATPASSDCFGSKSGIRSSCRLYELACHESGVMRGRAIGTLPERQSSGSVHTNEGEYSRDAGGVVADTNLV
jgi:hypothetical protein